MDTKSTEVLDKSAPTGKDGACKQAIDGRKAGQIAHLVIADLAKEGDWSPGKILSTVGGHLALRAVGSYQGAAKKRIATAAGVYGRFFCPGPYVELEAVEFSVPGGRLDLLWHDLAAEVRWADEIKTGRAGTLLTEEALRDQLSRQAKGGDEVLDNFLGVRVCTVNSPALSMLWLPNGDVVDPEEVLPGCEAAA